MIEDCVDPLAHRDRTVVWEDLRQLFVCLALRATEDHPETKETKDSVYHIFMESKVKLDPQGQGENLARMETLGKRACKVLLETQETWVCREKKVKGDPRVMVVVPLVLLALVVSQDWKERKVFMVLKEKLVHQGVTSRGLKEKEV